MESETNPLKCENTDIESNEIKKNRSNKVCEWWQIYNMCLCITGSIVLVIIFVYAFAYIPYKMRLKYGEDYDELLKNESHNYKYRNIPCVNSFDLYHNNGLCDYKINNGFSCEEYFCTTCYYADYCDKSCGYF